MASTAPKYYRPYYPSDSEESDASADDSDVESQLADETQDLPDYVSFAQGLFRAAGPPFATDDKNIEYAVNALDRRTAYGPMVEGQEGYTTTTNTVQTDNVIVLQSLDRDKSIYPQPINCQLMLPRTYVNVTRFEIADISFIASFFYFRADKYNTTLLYQESGRVTFAPVLKNPSIVSPFFNLTLTIREGTYSIDSLLNELTIQFNTPPLFYDFINGFSDFYTLFLNAGDYSVNFNYPGDFYYDALTKVYITNPTTDQIVSYYFQQRYATPTTANNSYTTLQIRVAYYYPVIKELLLDVIYQTTAAQLIYAGSPIGSSAITQLIHNFAGLDDPVMIDILGTPTNITILDSYRLAHTFRYYPVNRYICSYSSQTNYVCIQSTSLNTSLTSLLNTTYSNLVITQIQQAGISIATFTSATAQITAFKSIISDMYNLLQTNLATAFGVNYGDLADVYFITFSNIILLKNGKHATNVSYDYNTSSNPLITTNLQSGFRQSNVTYWQNMFNIAQVNQSFSNVFIDSNSGVFVYNIKTLTSQNEHPFQDSTGNIYINPVEYSSDIIVNIRPGAYTIIPIFSSLRQTAQVETLPRASTFIYPEWNAANAGSIGTNISVFSYTSSPAYTFPTGTDSNGIGSNISYPLSPALVNFGRITTLSNTTLENFTLSLQATPNGMYFTFTTPIVTPVNGKAGYKYSTAVSIFPPFPFPSGDIPPSNALSNTFSDSMAVFIYHDQAAFFADVGPVGQSNGENPFFYKYTKVIPAGAGVQTIAFSSYENEVYYVYCRPLNKQSFTPISFTIVPFISSNAPILLNKDVNFDPRLPSFDPYVAMHSNYYVAKVHDPDYIRLPIIDSNGYYYKTSHLSCNIGFLPSANNTPASAPINILLQKPIVPLGYVNNVSDNLTDYIPIVNTFPPRAFDPINGFQFRYTPDVSSYNPISQNYDIGTSANVILTPSGTIYNFMKQSLVAKRHKDIVQYTGTHYIPTESNVFTQKSSNLQPLTSIQGLLTPFQTTGPCGFMFMPEDGTWNIERLTFLSQSSNTNVHFLAIFPTEYVNNNSIINISLDNSICICVLISNATYYDTPAPSGVPYGTYYTYKNVLVVQSNYVISGRTQNSPTLVTDTNSYYSAIAYSFSNAITLSNTIFTMDDFMNSSVTVIENLTGTCIPYPDLGFYISPTFYDGARTPDSYNMILSFDKSLTSIKPSQSINPNINPNFLYSNYYTSQYALSSPIVNSHLHYILSRASVNDFVNFTSYLSPVTPIPDIPVNLFTTIYGNIMIQTSTFPVFSYASTSTGSTALSLQANLTMDIVFPTTVIPLIQYGTSTSFIFLGVEGSSLAFVEYTPSTGVVNRFANMTSTFNPVRHKVQGFVIQGSRWWLTYLDLTAPRVLNIAQSTFSGSFASYTITFPTNIYSSELSIDPAGGSNLYFSVSTSSERTFSMIYSYPLSASSPPADVLTKNIYAVNANTLHFTIQVVDSIEYIYQVRLLSQYIFRTNTSTYTTDTSAQNLGTQPVKCISGASNSLWVIFDTSPYIMAYVTLINSINIAWQQLFPVMKIELTEVSEKRLTIPDTYNIPDPEWGHSVAFGYSNYQTLARDIYYTQPSAIQAGVNQWGREAYYQVADTSFQGFYFNAYLENLPLQASNTSYVALRGFSPTESYQTQVRVSLPNIYDFGYVSIDNIISEIASLSTSPAKYSVDYSQQLSTFDGLFARSNGNSFYGVSSFSVPTTGFSNFITQYSTLYGQYTGLTANVNTINSNVRVSMQNFILSDMQYILPSNILTRTRFTDSLTFSFLWKTALQETPPSYANLVDGWGLGWNLGYAKQDDSYPSTVHFAPSMFKIIEDFLYLRLNPEFNLNRMSAGTKENYLDSREPSGLTSYYYCKLILNGYGQTATTFVHSPIILNPPISRITKVSFQWLDSKGNLLNIPSATDSDWQMTVNIQENVKVTSFTQTSNITASQYLTPLKE